MALVLSLWPICCCKLKAGAIFFRNEVKNYNFYQSSSFSKTLKMIGHLMGLYISNFGSPPQTAHFQQLCKNLYGRSHTFDPPCILKVLYSFLKRKLRKLHPQFIILMFSVHNSWKKKIIYLNYFKLLPDAFRQDGVWQCRCWGKS